MSLNIKELFNLKDKYTEEELDLSYLEKINKIKLMKLCNIDKQILYNYYTHKYKEDKNTFVINDMSSTFSNNTD